MRFRCSSCAYVFNIQEKVSLKKVLNPKLPDDAVSAKEEMKRNPKTQGKFISRSERNLFQLCVPNAIIMKHIFFKCKLDQEMRPAQLFFAASYVTLGGESKFFF